LHPSLQISVRPNVIKKQLTIPHLLCIMYFARVCTSVGQALSAGSHAG
jgi:hypothetical protein